MKTYSKLVLTVFWGIWAIISGCTGNSAPTQFYLLNTDAQVGQEAGGNDQGILLVGIGPLVIPAYLDRPQIITRTRENRLNLAEFDNWAEPLQETLSRLVVAHLSTLLDPKVAFVFPWRGGVELDYQIPIEVIRMDNNLSGDALMIARWSVLTESDKKLLSAQTLSYTEKTDLKDFEAFAAAHSKNFASMCRDIARVIQEHVKDR